MVRGDVAGRLEFAGGLIELFQVRCATEVGDDVAECCEGSYQRFELALESDEGDCLCCS